jgi:diguanylate cyclase (GGDEF)-like protein
MLRVYSCIAHDHDTRILVVAAGVCFIAACTAFAVFDQARAGGRRRLAWGALAAFVSGIGIWSTHFIAMLAYKPNLPVGYDLDITLLSVVTAIVVTGFGWAASLSPGKGGALIGGLLLGTGIGAMHWLGMAGMRVPGRIVWDQDLLALSTLLGVALSTAALLEHRRAPSHIPWRPALLLTLAICSLHFIGMAAASIVPDPSIAVPAEVIETDVLAVAVTALALLILTISFIVVLFDRSMAKRELEDALRVNLLAEALKRQADIANAALDNMAQGLSMFDADDRLITFNRRYAEIYSMPDGLLVPGVPVADILRYLVDTGAFPGDISRYINETASSPLRAIHTDVELASGRVIDVQRRPLPDGGWVATHEDITERREAARRIAYLAGHDTLTGLPNRVSFGDQIRASLARVSRGRHFALHSIDLDRFKEVNDTLGHPIGDQILKQVASRLTGLLRDDDHVTRLGGDEFAVIQSDVSDPAHAAVLATRMIASLSEPFEFDGHTVVIGATVGIAFAPADGTDADELLKKSDMALYRAKAESRGTFCLFEKGMDSRLRERRELEGDLRTAISQGQFELHYQPILNLATRGIAAFEALIRWHHPTRGLVQPNDFIATAEETGLIIPVGEWVLRQACRDAAGWPDGIKVAVNLSAAQFKRGDLVSVVTSALATSGLAPERLELEITESVLLNDEDWVLSVLQSLRALGVRIALDDFGTGYSSLSYLRTFPFSKIKIDRAFVSDIARTADGLAIVQATIQLSEKLGMITTAEGVETLDQMNILDSEGCTEVQGFHISRAVPAAAIPALITLHGGTSTRTRAAA